MYKKIKIIQRCYLMPFIRYFKVAILCTLGIYTWINSFKTWKVWVLSKVCIEKIKTIGHTMPEKLLICYPEYFGHVQAHLPKIGKVFEISDVGLSGGKTLKQSIKPFLWYCILKISAIWLVIWTCLSKQVHQKW